jgi:hypothetical protein
MIDKIIFKAYFNLKRKGETIEVVEAIKGYIKSAEIIVVPTTNYAKLKAINEVLESFGLR